MSGQTAFQVRKSTRHMEPDTDSLVILCSLFPRNNMSVHDRGIETIRIKAIKAAKSRDVNMYDLNRSLQQDIILRFLPCLYYQWQEFCKSTVPLKDCAYMVPLTIYPEAGCVQTLSGRNKAELIALSKLMDRSNFRRRNSVESSVPSNGHPSREYAISYVPEEILEKSDTIIIIENAEPGSKNIPRICVYANGCNRIWDAYKERDTAFSIDLNNADSYSDIVYLIDCVLKEDINGLCSKYVSPIKDDTYEFFAILITKENGHFKFNYHIRTNKSHWFMAD